MPKSRVVRIQEKGIPIFLFIKDDQVNHQKLRFLNNFLASYRSINSIYTILKLIITSPFNRYAY